MEKLWILSLGVIIGMLIFWLWWKKSEIDENKEIKKIFNDVEKKLSEEKGVEVRIDNDAKELIELTTKAGVFEDENKN